MGRTPCCDKANVKKGPWSPEEDAKLKEFIQKYGTGGNWIALPQKAGLKRCGKSCRLRWLNYLRPNIKHGDFSEEEDKIICRLYDQIRTKWSVIAAHLPGRTDNDIKNYWNTKLKKKYMAAATNNSIMNPNPSNFFPLTPSQLIQSQQLYVDHFHANESTNADTTSLSGLHQTLSNIWSNTMNTPQSLVQMITQDQFNNPTTTLQQNYFYNQLMSENLGFDLGFRAGDHHHHHHNQQEPSSGSSGGSFMSRITQEHKMGHLQNYSSSNTTISTITEDNFQNPCVQFDHSINIASGGFGNMGLNSYAIIEGYDHLEEVKPMINNNSDIGYLGLELDGNNKKNEEREEIYFYY